MVEEEVDERSMRRDRPLVAYVGGGGGKGHCGGRRSGVRTSRVAMALWASDQSRDVEDGSDARSAVSSWSTGPARCCRS